MGRTRLRGIEIAGLRFAIEVPPTLSWRWPERLEELECPPLDPEIHVGVRVGHVKPPSGDTFFYESSGVRFEIGPEEDGWVIATYSRDGICERVARFDQGFSLGEIVVTSQWAGAGRYPLEHPLDEVVLLHRVIHDGGLVLRGTVGVTDGQALVFLTERAEPSPRSGYGSPTPSDQPLVLRGDRGRIDDSDRIVVHTTPWASQSACARLIRAPLYGIHLMQARAQYPMQSLDPLEAVGEILQFACAPVHDPAMADRIFGVIEAMTRRTAVARLRKPELKGVVSFTWQNSQASFGFAGLPIRM